MKSILLIGVGRFGKHIALKLGELNHQVMVVDKQEERINAILPFVTNAQIGDSTNEEFLQSLGIRNYDVCIVAIGNDFQSSLETTSLLKEMGAKMVVSRAARDVQAKFLLRNGADDIELSSNYAIFEVTIPKNWIGKTVGEIDIRNKYSITIMAVKKEGKMDLTVSSSTEFETDETMLVLGRYQDVKKCFHI